jgi:carbonic anhydrase/acetyltransferase-like protein (isoleucine patch superfamily)
VVLGEGVIVLANALIRSVGGHGRPAFAVRIGDECVVAPHVTLAGCEIGERGYLATGVVVLQEPEWVEASGWRSAPWSTRAACSSR